MVFFNIWPLEVFFSFRPWRFGRDTSGCFCSGSGGGHEWYGRGGETGEGQVYQGDVWGDCEGADALQDEGVQERVYQE